MYGLLAMFDIEKTRGKTVISNGNISKKRELGFCLGLVRLSKVMQV